MRPAALALFALAAAAPAPAQERPPAAVAGRVTAVTVYRQTALVTRDVPAPEAAGPAELVVSPLPASTVGTSLYAEGGDGVRVLNVRFRSRALAEDTRDEVRKLELQIKELAWKEAQLTADLKALEQNTATLGKLEGFTAATLTQLTEKGQLDSEKTIALITFVREGRAKAAKEEVALRQGIAANAEAAQYARRQLAEKSAGVSRTERDAVVVLEKTKPGAATVKLSYLVESASWRPRYKLRAGAKAGEKVVVEYLAALTQQTGEDWAGVNVVLSTAQPMLNAAPPELKALEVAVGPTPPGRAGGKLAEGAKQQADVPAASSYLRGLEDQSRNLRFQGQNSLNMKDNEVGNRAVNEAAALESYRDLVVAREEVVQKDGLAAGADQGPSVAYALPTRLALPSRADEQVLEIARLELEPRYYYKAVPVLTPHVYRLADLVNTTETVLLPGEATAYVGGDFVGQTALPLVASGRSFTVGFGVDPQLQATRKLLDKTRTTQGGNQVLGFKYQVLLSSYKPEAVEVQVWDRMPHAEAANAIAVTLAGGEKGLSPDKLYQRDERPKNLLRWDVKLEPKQNADKALTLDYEYRLEFDRNLAIGAFMAR